MHARCVCERKPFRSSYFFLTKHVHWSRDEVVHTGTVHVRVLVTWQRTNSVTIDRVTVQPSSEGSVVCLLRLPG